MFLYPNSTLNELYSLIALADGWGGLETRPLLGPISLIFMQFSAKSCFLPETQGLASPHLENPETDTG